MMSKTLKSLSRQERRLKTVDRLQSPDRDRQVSLRWVNRARDFLKSIGLPFEIVPSYVPDPSGSFFKGCWLADGKLYFCPARVQAGELLHEAGHLALLPRSRWHLLQPGEMVGTCPPLGMFSEMGDLAVEAWDYSAALTAEIPELVVFWEGFNGAGFRVWESFSERKHPGFALLRFLGMSSQWGTCDRWFVGNGSVAHDEQTVVDLLETCTPEEVKAIMTGIEALKKQGEMSEAG